MTVTNIKWPGPTNIFGTHQFVSTDYRHPLRDLLESRLTGKLEINVCAGTLFCRESFVIVTFTVLRSA